MERPSTQFDAIYENGVLRPLVPVDLPEHERRSVLVNRRDDPLVDRLDWDAHQMDDSEGDDRVSLERSPKTWFGFCSKTAPSDQLLYLSKGMPYGPSHENKLPMYEVQQAARLRQRLRKSPSAPSL